MTEGPCASNLAAGAPDSGRSLHVNVRTSERAGRHGCLRTKGRDQATLDDGAVALTGRPSTSARELAATRGGSQASESEARSSRRHAAPRRRVTAAASGIRKAVRRDAMTPASAPPPAGRRRGSDTPRGGEVCGGGLVRRGRGQRARTGTGRASTRGGERASSAPTMRTIARRIGLRATVPCRRARSVAIIEKTEPRERVGSPRAHLVGGRGPAAALPVGACSCATASHRWWSRDW